MQSLVSWKFFRGRLKLSPKEFINYHKCLSYDDLVKVLQHRGVSPPSESEVSSFFNAVVTEETVKQKAPEAASAKPTAAKVPPTPNTKPRARRPRTVKQKVGAEKKTKGSKDGARSTN